MVEEDKDRTMKGLAGQVIQEDSRIYSNLGQEIIVTTEDKIRLCLIKHVSRMERRNSWIAPLGVFIAVGVVFPTTTFQPFLSLSADTWKAMFIIVGIISFGWLIRTLMMIIGASSSIDHVVAEIKRTGIGQEVNGEDNKETRDYTTYTADSLTQQARSTDQ